MSSKFALASLAALCAMTAACDRGGSSNQAAPGQPAEAQEKAGDQSIAAGLDQASRFAQAAKAAGLDGTLAGPGPYTVLVPSNDAFAKVQGGVLSDAANPQNRAELTRILTYHILPGTVLVEDLGKAVDNGKGKALVGTMNGETLTATKDGDKLVLADSSGAKATIVDGDQKRSNGVVHYIDMVLAPAAGSQQAQE